jgi:hypothetical protein
MRTAWSETWHPVVEKPARAVVSAVIAWIASAALVWGTQGKQAMMSGLIGSGFTLFGMSIAFVLFFGVNFFVLTPRKLCLEAEKRADEAERIAEEVTQRERKEMEEEQTDRSLRTLLSYKLNSGRDCAFELIREIQMTQASSAPASASYLCEKRLVTWQESTREFIRANLGESYAAQFANAAGVPVPTGELQLLHLCALGNRLHTRLFRLGEIIHQTGRLKAPI